MELFVGAFVAGVGIGCGLAFCLYLADLYESYQSKRWIKRNFGDNR